MPWTPTLIDVGTWGKIQIVINGVDVTYYQGAPTTVRRMRSREPFGDESLELYFPKIGPFVALPVWLTDGAPVEVYRVPPAGPKETLFEGQYVLDEDEHNSGSGDEGTVPEFGLTMSSIGELYTANWFRKPPELNRPRADSVDIANIIQRELSPTTRPQLRLLPTIKPGNMGIIYTQKGAWNLLLDGYIQDMLAMATSSGLPVPGEAILGITTSPTGDGYWMVGTGGSVLPFGNVKYQGSMIGIPLQEPASRVAVSSDGLGYWMAAKDGGVFAFNVPFYGSLGQTANPNDIVAIEATPGDDGYWLADVIGGVFAFGSATFYGSIPEVGAPELVAGDKIVDFGRTPSGTGYFLLSQKGYIYAWGDASYQGGAEATGKTFVAMSVRTNNSYWLLANDGTVYGYGAAPTFSPNPVTPLNLPASDIVGTSSGSGYLIVAQDGGVFAYGDADFYGSVPGGGGNDSQWTLHMDRPRQPIIRVKDTTTVHWTVACGAYGVDHTLHRDQALAHNVFFGEGIDEDNGRWRNSRYPNYRLDSAPVFNGTTLGVGSTHGDVTKWETEMNARWSTAIAVDGVFSQSDANECRRFQRQAGLAETGTINAQTWVATFQTGSNSSDPNSAYFWPLAQDPRIEQFLFNPSGDATGSNPAFNPGVIRRETYDNYGNRVSKAEGLASALARLRRESTPGRIGTVTLWTDPIEGSRFSIREGQNIKFQYYRGGDLILHIVEVEKDFDNLTVTLSVDEKARDWVSYAAFMQAYREGTDPANRQKRVFRNSRITEDRRAVWDTEAGGGVIPRHVIEAGMWNVLRIPVGEEGNVVRSEFWTTPNSEARIGVGVFNKEVTHAKLVAVGSEGPLGLTDDGDLYWDTFDDTWGLLQAWGEEGQAGGYFPGLESNEDDLPTDYTRDDGSWYYWTANPPWVWVAMWSDTTTEIWGRLYPGVD